MHVEHCISNRYYVCHAHIIERNVGNANMRILKLPFIAE